MADAKKKERDFWARSAKAYLQTPKKHKLAIKIFRFSDLPDELQSNVLRHTDLIAPHDLKWDTRWRTFVCHGWFRPTEDGEDELEPEWLRTGRCECWKVPSALFLVSKKIGEEARRIFYGENKFAVLLEGGRVTIIQETPSDIGVLRFLARLPSIGLEHLRSLEIVFPNFRADYLYPGETGAHDWADAVDFLESSAKLSNLRLTLDMGGALHWMDTKEFKPEEVTACEAAMWRTYQRIVEPLTQLKGLRNFYVHLAWPLSIDNTELRKQQELTLERSVMGDEYEAADKFKGRNPNLRHHYQTPVWLPDWGMDHTSSDWLKKDMMVSVKRPGFSIERPVETYWTDGRGILRSGYRLGDTDYVGRVPEELYDPHGDYQNAHGRYRSGWLGLIDAQGAAVKARLGI